MLAGNHQTRNRTKRNGRQNNNTLLLVGNNRRTPTRIGEANKSPSPSPAASFFTSVTGVLSGTIGAKRISNVTSPSSSSPKKIVTAPPSTGLFSNLNWMNRSRSYYNTPILSHNKKKTLVKQSAPANKTTALHRRANHDTSNNHQGNLLSPPPPQNGFYSVGSTTNNHDHVIPSFLITNIVRHSIVILFLTLFSIIIPLVSKTPHTSFALQTIVNAFLLLILMWLWICKSPARSMNIKTSHQPTINHGIMVALLFYSIWIIYGLLASHIFIGIPHVNIKNPLMETNTSSYFWLTGWIAEAITAAVAIFSHLPGMSKKWPDTCRYMIGPLLLLLFFFPNPAIVTDPQLWSLVKQQKVWLTIITGVLRSTLIYLICVVSWQTVRLNQQHHKKKEIDWIQRIAICYCRILWLTQTTSVLVLILGSIISFCLILTDSLSNSSAPDNDHLEKSVHFQQAPLDPELGYKTPNLNSMMTNSPSSSQLVTTSILKSPAAPPPPPNTNVILLDSHMS